MGVATGCGCKEVYKFPNTTYRVYRSDRWYLATTPSAEFYFSENVENVRKKFRNHC